MSPKANPISQGGLSGGKKWSKKRKWFFGSVLVLGLLVGAYFLFQNKIVDTQLRPVIERELTKAVNSPVSIGSVRAGLTGDVNLDLVVLTIPGYPWETRLEVERVSVNVELFNLLFHRKPLENCLVSLSFIRPKIFLVRNEKAIAAAATVVGPPGPVPENKVPIPLFAVPKIIIQDGLFSVQAEKTPREMLRGLNFEAQSQNGATWGLVFQAQAPDLQSHGALRFNGSLKLDELKVSGKLLLEKWPLVSVHSVLKELAGWELLSGTIDAESPVAFDPAHGLWFDAKTTVSQASVKSPAPTAITLSQITGRADIRPNEINVPGEILFSLGDTVWKASGIIPFDSRPLAVRTKTDQLFLSSVFTEILKLKDLKVDGTGTATLAVSGPMSNPVIQGVANLGPSHVGKGSLDSLTVNAGYEKGNVRLYKAVGKLYDGDFEANGFIPLTGEKNAPVSLRAILKNIEAQKLAADFGIDGMEGRGDVEAHYSGTRETPILSLTSQMTLTRTLRNTLFNYSVHTNLQLTEQKLTLSTVIGDKARLEAELSAQPDAWEVKKFTFSTGKKSGKLTGGGKFPKNDEGPIDIQIHGSDIALQDLPFFNDQFPDILGKVKTDTQISGTRKEPRAKILFSSPEVKIRDLPPQPLDGDLSWKPDEWIFDKLTYGEIFSVQGNLGRNPDSPIDLKINAKEAPLRIISEIGVWKNPPQPFEGLLTGRLHILGVKKNPIIEGNDGIKVTSLQLGEEWADKVEALSKFEDGKLLIKKFKVTQGDHFLSAVGTWDTRSKPGIMNLHLSAHEFQLGKGPFLSGDFLWEAKTGDPWWKNWDGTFSSAAITIQDLKKNTKHFNDFSMVATSEDFVIKGKVKIGNSIAGTAILNLASSPVEIQALLKIPLVSLAQAPELVQFLPESFKTTGEISGQIQLKNGTFAELPMVGAFTIKNGTIPGYDFDRMELTLTGNKQKIALNFTLARDQAKYSLAGTLESSGAFWDSQSKINLNGPFQGEKLVNLLALSGLSVEKHKIMGGVDGNLTATGVLWNPTVGFSMKGENLRFDSYVAPSAELNLSYFERKITLQKNKVSLAKGEINIEKGNFYFDPQDPAVVILDLSGSTQNVPVASVFDLTSQIHLTGRFALEEKDGRPTFDGILSYLDARPGMKNPTPFDLAIQVHKKTVEFKPLDTEKAQIVGRLDWSQDRKIIFQNIHLEHSPGLFSVDGTFDLDGNSHFVSDAKNIPIEQVGKWILPKFPLSGTGNYHLIFDGTLDSPVFTSSFSVANGKIGDLQFDLLDGELKSKESTLFLGSKESPITLSRKGFFSFNVWGKSPMAFTKTGMLKVKDREMDITAEMDKGDFSLILLAGLAKKASGEMDFSAHVGGTLDNPVLTMDLDLNHCQMVPEIVAQSIEDISGRIKVRNNRLAVEDLNGRIGQGRVFISSPPIEESKMVLENFIPNYLDFRVQTVGDHGLWLSIPTIMRKGEWGEIYFQGTTPKEPMLIRGPLSEPHVIGTGLLESGHYTFPPVEATDDHGAKIEYRELAGVFFDLKLKSGKNTWYSNDFNGNYIELKVNPGDEIKLEGKDADRTPEEAGIKCYGSAGSRAGWLRYFGHEFKLAEASLFMSKGKPPTMQGHATDRFLNADVISAGGSRKADVDVWVDFKGTFGDINFTFDSSPRFSTDPELAQKILLSNIVFGRDMTGLSREDLRKAYDQNAFQGVSNAGFEAVENYANAKMTEAIRPLTNHLGIGEVDIKQHVSSNLLFNSNSNPSTASGIPQTVMDANGNTLSGGSVPIAQVIVRKPIGGKLSIVNTVGLMRDLVTDKAGVQEQFGLSYELNNNLQLNATTGQRDDGIIDTKATLDAHFILPDIMRRKKVDKEKPRFERFDVYPSGPGKFQLIWVTDKVTKSEVKVIDPDNQMVQDILEKKQHDYRHDMVIENLNSDVEYKIQIFVKDLNDNETMKEQKVEPISGSADSSSE